MLWLISVVEGFTHHFMATTNPTLHHYKSVCGIDYTSQAMYLKWWKIQIHLTVYPYTDYVWIAIESQWIACKYLFSQRYKISNNWNHISTIIHGSRLSSNPVTFTNFENFFITTRVCLPDGLSKRIDLPPWLHKQCYQVYYSSNYISAMIITHYISFVATS